MRDLVDGQEQVLVGGGAEDVGDGPELPGEEGSVAQEMGEEQLEADDSSNDVLGQRLGTAELGDLDGGGTAESERARPIEWNKGQLTSGWALMMASRRVRCGSSV